MMHQAVCTALAALLAANLAACSGTGAASPSPGATPRHTVRVATVQATPFGATLTAVGLLAPKDQSRLAFKVGGYVESLPVAAGDALKSGQLLASLKRTEIEAALDQARESQAKALRDLNRARALYNDGVATLEQVEDLTTAYRVASAAERTAAFNAQNAEIRAPQDGVVLEKLADVHDLVQAGQPILVVGRLGRGWVVRAGLADRDVVRVRTGGAVSVEFDAWPGRVFDGRIVNIASAADPATGTFTVEVSVEPGAPPGGAAFVQGLVAKLRLSAEGVRTALAVPVQALIEANGNEAGVFVLDDDHAHVRRVTIETGAISEGRIEVRGGIAAGAQIVIDGAAFVENGEAVRVTQDPA